MLVTLSGDRNNAALSERAAKGLSLINQRLVLVQLTTK